LLLLTINLEDGRPTRHQAVLRLQHELHKARSARATAVKIIHGYGSSGVGGVLKYVVWAELRQMKERGQLQSYVAGENWRVSDEISWEIVKKHPELKQDSDFGRGNKGITIALL
jgi:hypothetical protein